MTLPILSKPVIDKMRAGLQTAYYSIGNRIPSEDYNAGMNHIDALEEARRKKEND